MTKENVGVVGGSVSIKPRTVPSARSNVQVPFTMTSHVLGKKREKEGRERTNEQNKHGSWIQQVYMEPNVIKSQLIANKKT